MINLVTKLSPRKIPSFLEMCIERAKTQIRSEISLCFNCTNRSSRYFTDVNNIVTAEYDTDDKQNLNVFYTNADSLNYEKKKKKDLRDNRHYRSISQTLLCRCQSRSAL